MANLSHRRAPSPRMRRRYVFYLRVCHEAVVVKYTRPAGAEHKNVTVTCAGEKLFSRAPADMADDLAEQAQVYAWVGFEATKAGALKLASLTGSSAATEAVDEAFVWARLRIEVSGSRQERRVKHREDNQSKREREIEREQRENGERTFKRTTETRGRTQRVNDDAPRE